MKCRGHPLSNEILPGSQGTRRNPHIPHFRDTMLLFGWIASLLIIAGVCWTLTLPLRDRLLVRAVNRVLEQSGDVRRLGEHSPSGGKSGSFIVGSWYTMILARQSGAGNLNDFSEGTKAFVFSFVGEGTFFPCAAVMLPDGKVREFIPLSSHGERVLKKISSGILKLYARRIEGAE